MNKQLFKVGTLYMIGTLFSKGITFLVTPIYTRIMSVNDYGIVSTYNSWVSIITIIVSLAMYMGIRAAFIDHENQKKEILATTINFNMLTAIILSVISCIIYKFVFRQLNIILVLCCLVQSAYAAFHNDYTMYLMMDKNYKKRLFYMMVPELLASIVSIFCVIFLDNTEKYYSVILSSVLVFLIFAVWIWIETNFNVKRRISFSALKYSLGISLPLVFHGMSLYILNQSDKVMITLLRNTEETGIYSLVYNLGMLSTAVTYALDGVWIPWYTDKLKKGNIALINQKVFQYSKAIAVIMGVLMLIAPELIKIFAPEEYWQGMTIVPAIVVANFVIFLYTFYVNNEHFYKKTIYIAINSLIGAMCNLILNVLLIPRFGYVAAAYTTLTAYIVVLILHAINSRKLQPRLYPLHTFINSFICVIVVVPYYYLTMDNIFWRLLGLVLYCCCIVVLNRNTVVDFVIKTMIKK